MKDTRNGAHTQQQLAHLPGVMASTGETFSVAWPGQAPACCGPWREACRHPDFLPPMASGTAGNHTPDGAGFSFVQISDSHIGFNKAANQDVTGTLKLALDKINRLPVAPDLLLHTGDISHSSKPAEFDTAQQLIQGAKVGQTFYVPGEHDTASDDGVLYHERSARIR